MFDNNGLYDSVEDQKMKKSDDVSSKNDKRKENAGQSEEGTVEKNTRRRFVAGVTTGTVATLGATTGRWVKPVVDSVVLPAHAQTSANFGSNLVARLVVTEDDADNPAYSRFSFGDGSHTVDGFDDANGVDDPHFEFLAEFQPPIDPPVEVKLKVQTDGNWDFDAQTFSRTGSVSSSKVLEALDSDDADDGGGILATFSAPGFPTRRIFVNFNG